MTLYMMENCKVHTHMLDTLTNDNVSYTHSLIKQHKLMRTWQVACEQYGSQL